jgi:chemotaxis-related protein WspD
VIDLHTDNEGQNIHDCWNRIGVRGDHSCEKLREHVHCRNCEVYAAAARNIMQRVLPNGYQSEWAQHVSQAQAEGNAVTESAMIFRIGNEWLALPTHLFVSVAEKTTAHKLPHRNEVGLLGIVNVAGQLYPCMSLAALLHIDAQQEQAKVQHHVYPRLLLVSLAKQVFALPVDDLQGISRYAADTLQAPPATVNKGLVRYLTGVLAVGEQQVGCLDHELVGYNLARALA